MTLNILENSLSHAIKPQEMKREDVLRSPEYWFEHAQNELYDEVVQYLEREQISRTQLAKKLNVSKSYVSQILNGHFNYTLKRLIELGLAIGVVPRIYYQKPEDMIGSKRIPKPANQSESQRSKRFSQANTRRTSKRRTSAT